MRDGKTIWLSLSYFHPIYRQYYDADLYLPMKEHEVRDVLHKLRAEKISDPAIEISILENEGLPSLDTLRLDTTSVPELDYLARRMKGLNEKEQLVFQALTIQLVHSERSGLISVKDLINRTYFLDSVPVISELWHDAQLGEYVIANNLNEDIATLPDDMKEIINLVELGRTQREKEQGVYVSGNYVITRDYQIREIYDGVNLPLRETNPPFVFGFEIVNVPKGDENVATDTAEWIYLPVSKNIADEIARHHGKRRIEDSVYLGYETVIPQITEELLGDLKDFPKYNMLAARISLMSFEERCLFQAILSAEQPKDIDELLDITENVCLYEFSPKETDQDDFFREYLSRHLDAQFDRAWLEQLPLKHIGNELLVKLGASVTEYGAISARGRKLYELVPYREEENAEVQEQRSEEADVEVGMKM